MRSDPTHIVVVAALIIGTMLTLFVRAISRSARPSRPSISNTAEDPGAKIASSVDHMSVYPFYVDCSRSIER